MKPAEWGVEWGDTTNIVQKTPDKIREIMRRVREVRMRTKYYCMNCSK